MDETNNDKATLRVQAAALLFQANSQAASIQRAIDSTHDDSGLRSRLAAAAAQLANIEGELSGALNSVVFSLRPADLMLMQENLSSENTEALVAEAATEGVAETIRVIDAASVDTRHEVESLHRDIFEDRIFDSYLHFTSPDDEAGFRTREAASRKYIETQLARHTPEGDLNAGGGTESHMLDLYAHGADSSPEFMPRWTALTERMERQRSLMRAAGQSTAEYDHVVSDGVRSFLKAKGLSDEEVNSHLAATVNPIDAAKPFVRLDSASEITKSSKIYSVPRVIINPTSSRVEPTRDTQLGVDFDAISAKLQAAGIQLSCDATMHTAHGLTIQKTVAKATPVVGN